jgi:hypothetical protein
LERKNRYEQSAVALLYLAGEDAAAAVASRGLSDAYHCIQQRESTRGWRKQISQIIDLSLFDSSVYYNIATKRCLGDLTSR